MSASQHIRRPATLRRATVGSKDALGDVQPGTPVPLATYAEVQQTHVNEIRDGRVVSVEVLLGILRPDVEPDAADELVVGSDTYTFDGDPWPVVHPRTQRLSHYEAKLRRVT